MSLGRRPREDALQQGARKKPCVIPLLRTFLDIIYSPSRFLYWTSSAASDPLVHHGRHFGRTVFAFANVKSLIVNGLDRMANQDTGVTESFSDKYVPVSLITTVSINNPSLLNRERREDFVFKNLLRMCHGLENRLMSSSSEEIELIGDLVTVSISQYALLLTLLPPRFRGVLINPVLTTQKE